ncbi:MULTISPECIES: TetR/AcrR family transcriptional regulator [Vibrio]|nr:MULTISPECIES: TetR/AcrR family transcriptional regulator C-terminal domain-containing protein [Vibrio]MCG7514867.1 TetR/AcrR family transcriptional regulator C-terminal domain-containing protein [Vibrio sp. MMH1-50]MCG9609650.1 TetR/AcrR family transcriptional regulator C-terminal domain-containing protein [Vibrio harveyi]
MMSEKSSKGRPAQISRKDVVECALNLGLENVSMHALGKQLGVSATALYRHVGSKEALVDLCCDYVLGKVALPQEKDWEAYLYTFAKNFRQALMSIPGSVAFIRHSQSFTPASSIIVNDILGIFREAKFEAEVGFMAFASVYTRVTDIVEHQEQAARNKPQSLPELDDEQLPHFAWLMSQAKPVNYEKYFDDGIRITIEGLKAVYK